MKNGLRLAAPPDSVGTVQALLFGLKAAVLLSLVAVVAIFRFRLGMIPTLALCSALGVAVYALN